MAGEDDVNGDVVASEPSAVLAAFLRMVEQRRQGVGRVFPAVIPVFGTSHLGHSQIMALGMAGAYEADNLGACEPTVRKYIVELHTALDGTPYHFYSIMSVILLVSYSSILLTTSLSSACSLLKRLSSWSWRRP